MIVECNMPPAGEKAQETVPAADVSLEYYKFKFNEYKPQFNSLLFVCSHK